MRLKDWACGYAHIQSLVREATANNSKPPSKRILQRLCAGTFKVCVRTCALFTQDHERTRAHVCVCVCMCVPGMRLKDWACGYAHGIQSLVREATAK